MVLKLASIDILPCLFTVDRRHGRLRLRCSTGQHLRIDQHIILVQSIRRSTSTPPHIHTDIETPGSAPVIVR